MIAAADAAAKTADVRVGAYDKADAGLVTVYVWGDVASVKAAVEAGKDAAARVGKLISAHVIPRPDPQLAAMLRPPSSGSTPSGRKNAEPEADRIEESASAYAAMSVTELRRLARSAPGLPISGRRISAAGKAELIRLLAGREKGGEGDA